MTTYATCALGKGEVSLRFVRLGSWRQRLVGLLGTHADAQPVVLCGCSSIHTCGMRYAIDVALVSREGLVIIAKRNVVPWRLVSGAGAYYAFERPALDGPWFVDGTKVEIALDEVQ